MDQCIYYMSGNRTITIVALYVDDVLIFSSSKEEEEKIVKELSNSFKMKDLGEATSILGINIERHDSRGIKQSQSHKKTISMICYESTG